MVEVIAVQIPILELPERKMVHNAPNAAQKNILQQSSIAPQQSILDAGNYANVTSNLQTAIPVPVAVAKSATSIPLWIKIVIGVVIAVVCIGAAGGVAAYFLIAGGSTTTMTTGTTTTITTATTTTATTATTTSTTSATTTSTTSTTSVTTTTTTATTTSVTTTTTTSSTTSATTTTTSVTSTTTTSTASVTTTTTTTTTTSVTTTTTSTTTTATTTTTTSTTTSVTTTTSTSTTTSVTTTTTTTTSTSVTTTTSSTSTSTTTSVTTTTTTSTTTTASTTSTTSVTSTTTSTSTTSATTTTTTTSVTTTTTATTSTTSTTSTSVTTTTTTTSVTTTTTSATTTTTSETTTTTSVTTTTTSITTTTTSITTTTTSATTTTTSVTTTTTSITTTTTSATTTTTSATTTTTSATTTTTSATTTTTSITTTTTSVTTTSTSATTTTTSVTTTTTSATTTTTTTTPIPCVNMRWNMTGVTIAGTTGVWGSAANQFNQPWNLFVDANRNMYVADAANHRIQFWANGASSGTTIAGITGGWGSAANRFDMPTDIHVYPNGNFLVADRVNQRIQFFFSNSVSGSNGITTSAGWGGTGRFFGVGVDPSGRIIGSDSSNHALWRNNTVPLGYQGAGGASHQLNGNQGIAVDPNNGDVYIANTNQHTIVRWTPGSSTGTVVAGTNGVQGNTNTTMRFPVGVRLDPLGNLFVVDNNNHRIQLYCRFPTVSSTARTILGTGVAGNSATQLRFPSGLALDNDLNIYVADNDNHRIQRFTRIA